MNSQAANQLLISSRSLKTETAHSELEVACVPYCILCICVSSSTHIVRKYTTREENRWKAAIEQGCVI